LNYHHHHHHHHPPVQYISVHLYIAAKTIHSNLTNHHFITIITMPEPAASCAVQGTLW